MSDTSNIIFRVPSGGNLVVAAPIGESLMSVAIRNNVPGIEAECGGGCICATYDVHCDEISTGKLRQPSADEDEMRDTTASERRSASRRSYGRSQANRSRNSDRHALCGRYVRFPRRDGCRSQLRHLNLISKRRPRHAEPEKE